MCSRNRSRLAASLPVCSASSWVKNTFICVNVDFPTSFAVSGNLAKGCPFFNDTSGISFSSLLVTLLFATLATLLVLTALNLVSNFSIALFVSSFAVAAALSPAIDSVLFATGFILGTVEDLFAGAAGGVLVGVDMVGSELSM